MQIELLRKRKNLGLKSQLKGDLAELIIPWLNESGCTGSELKHFGKPIDWIGFKGLDDPTAKIGIKIIDPIFKLRNFLFSSAFNSFIHNHF